MIGMTSVRVCMFVCVYTWKDQNKSCDKGRAIVRPDTSWLAILEHALAPNRKERTRAGRRGGEKERGRKLKRSRARTAGKFVVGLSQVWAGPTHKMRKVAWCSTERQQEKVCSNRNRFSLKLEREKEGGREKKDREEFCLRAKVSYGQFKDVCHPVSQDYEQKRRRSES